MQPESEETGHPLCPQCCHPHDQQAHYCAECGVPIGDTATIDPIKSIYARGLMFRNIVSRKHVPLWILLGIALIVAPSIGLPASLILRTTNLSFGFPDVLKLLVTLIPALAGFAIIVRVAQNYLRQHDGPDR